VSDEWLAAANGGDAQAQFILGNRYSLGQGVDEDLHEAARWWRKAAEQGHPGAQYNLGYAHMRGDGVPADPWASYLMFREAARGYRRWEQEGVRAEGLDLRTTRRDAKRMRLFVLPFYILKTIQLYFASVGIGRFRMFRQSTNAGNVELVARLIDSGMDVNAATRTGNTPLIHACAAGATAVVSLLLERGADVNGCGEGVFNSPPIRAAAQSGEPSVVDLLLAHGADVNAVAPVDGTNALIMAAIRGNTAILQSLLDAGADVNATNIQGATALHSAAQEGHSESVALLLKVGADPHASGLKQQVTPLFLAAQGGHVPVMRALVETGVDVNATNPDGYTPLHIAVLNDQSATTQYLIKAGANVRLKGGDDGYTPLHAAAIGSSKDATRVLLEAGADVNERSSSGVTALQIAESQRDKELVQLLRDRGAEE